MSGKSVLFLSIVSGVCLSPCLAPIMSSASAGRVSEGELPLRVNKFWPCRLKAGNRARLLELRAT